MKKYIDFQTLNGSVGIIGTDDKGNPIELIQAGTTINSMPVKYKDEYLMIEEKNSIFFIFDDCIPQISFYSVPRIDIFAIDKNEGYFGTVGSSSDIMDLEAPICYIDKSNNVYRTANNMKEFLFHLETMNEPLINMEQLLEIRFFNSFEDAREQLDFYFIGNIM
ncbi:MAG: hypothetical protein PHY91_09890 [Tissierellia bacterium]|nr:hypothetical protein [Tissierellia bacterium]MDD4726403.1 hypothetical protein [Tissierellia bacterium]